MLKSRNCKFLKLKNLNLKKINKIIQKCQKMQIIFVLIVHVHEESI